MTLAPIPADDALLQIIGHLGAAISQSIPEDDQIIMNHVRAAHEWATKLRDAQHAAKADSWRREWA